MGRAVADQGAMAYPREGARIPYSQRLLVAVSPASLGIARSRGDRDGSDAAPSRTWIPARMPDVEGCERAQDSPPGRREAVRVAAWDLPWRGARWRLPNQGSCPAPAPPPPPSPSPT